MIVPPTDANLNSISLEYPFDEVSRACRNFSQSYLLGKGSYGAVYRGILKDGTEVAVKVLSNPKDSGFKEEVLVLSKFRHPNLVILMGFSRNGKDRYLIYELLSGGDLCSRLQRDPGFDWRKRMTRRRRSIPGGRRRQPGSAGAAARPRTPPFRCW